VNCIKRSFRYLAAVAVVLMAAAGAAASLLRSSRDLDEGITSVALGGRVHARVILPAGYDDSPQRRYPVVYFLHGLPGSSSSYKGNDWLLDALAQAGPAILVLPQGARDGDTDPEYLDWGRGRNWSTYVSTELPHYIDSHFRTIARRSGRAIVGVSAGGYGAAVVGLNHLDRFSVVESWSGYFHPTDPTGTRALARGGLAIVHKLIGGLKSDQRRRPTYLAFYVGNGDVRFRAENVQFDRELTAAHVPHVFAIYPGAHETSLWQRHAATWLRKALAHLTKPT
jgi:S-formylglutathione hydrolase FrmB